MSLSQFQNALALLIRLPEDNRGNAFTDFVATFELDDSELEKLAILADDPRVIKYGRIMRGVRFDHLLRQIKILNHFLKVDAIEDLCFRLFEPKAALVRAREYGIEFMNFLMTDPKAISIIEKNAEDFVFDVIKYEHAQLQFRKQVLDRTCPIPGSRYLRHRCFRVLDLGYDIPAIMLNTKNVPKSRANDHPPKAKQHQLLLLGDLEIPRFRTFEVDFETAKFLRKQSKEVERRNFNNANTAKLPESYGDLVDIGLCHAATAH